jgi:uncharacterized membrane protein
MSELIAITYAERERAAEVLETLRRLQLEAGLELEDACIVTRDASGTLHLQQTLVQPPLATREAVWRAVIGAFALVPLVAFLVGAAASTMRLSAIDWGVDTEFLKSLHSRFQPGTSALFVLARGAALKTLLVEIRRHGGQVLHTSLSRDVERRLLRTLSASAASLR